MCQPVWFHIHQPALGTVQLQLREQAVAVAGNHQVQHQLRGQGQCKLTDCVQGPETLCVKLASEIPTKKKDFNKKSEDGTV